MTPVLQRPGKELVPEVVKKATPTIVVPFKKMIEKESETSKTTSSELSL